MIRISALALVFFFFSQPSIAQEFKVVAGTSVKFDSVSKKELRELYMGVKGGVGDQIVRPSHGPLAQTPMASFLDDILNVSERRFTQHWRIKLFASRGFPPKKFKNDADVLDFLKSNPRSVGIVGASTDAGNLKTITVQ